MYKKKMMDSKTKKTQGPVTGSHDKNILFGVLSNDGNKQLSIQQYNRFDGRHSFIRYLDEVRKKFKKFVIFVESAI
jgi:hypothetical protein